MASELRHRTGGAESESFKLRLMYPGSYPGVLLCQIEPHKTVNDLRAHARREHPLFCHYDTVTLIRGGMVLQDDSCLLRDVLDDKSAIMVGPPARAPARRVFRSADADEIQSMDAVGRDAVDEDLEEPDDMQGPSVSQRQKDIGNWLKRKCHMPSALLAVFYLMWMIGARWAAKQDFGALYVGGSIIALMLCNLGKRKPGEASGYSIFNTGFRRLPGDFDEQQLDNAFRGRM